MAVGISPEGGVDDFDVFLRDEFRIIAMFFVEIFLEGVVHGVDGGLAVVVAAHSVKVGFLDEKEQEK